VKQNGDENGVTSGAFHDGLQRLVVGWRNAWKHERREWYAMSAILSLIYIML
jgi:hypothetical protein